MAAVLEQASDAMLITDLRGVIQYVNPAFERMTGYRAAEAVGHTPRILKSNKNDPAVYENLWDTISRGRVWKGHLINKRMDGTYIQIDATIFPVNGPDGRIVNYAAVTRDITQEIELEARLRQTEKLEAIGQLASGIAHDFNNVLTAVLGNVGLLRAQLEQSGSQPDYLIKGLDEIERLTQQGASLTRQLLAFNRREPLKLAALDPNKVVSHAEQMLRRLLPSNIVFELALGAEVYSILADAGQIELVLMNLALNARDAMPRGGRIVIQTGGVILDELYVASHADACIGPHIFISVRDTGKGMSADVLRRIFEPFFTTKPAGKGTGLGLATVYAIVRRFGGHITVASAPNAGSEFIVYLPASMEGALESDDQQFDEPKSCGSETILVCEDDPTIRDLECELLARHGYNVIAAEHGKQALELIRSDAERIDLLITDVVMPEINGPALAAHLMALRPEIPVLFVTGYADEALVEMGAHLDHGQFLAKPFTARGLLHRVRRALDASPSPANQSATESNRRPRRTSDGQ